MVKTHHRSTSPAISGRLLAVLAILLSFATLAFGGEVEATLDRNSVPAGNGALVTIRISGKASRPEIPNVENLIINFRGQSQQIQIFNGSTSVTTNYSYAVGSMTPGEYVIPAFEVTVDGEKHTTQPLKLTVIDSSAAQPAEEQEPEKEQPQDNDPEAHGFLTVELSDSERKHVYVGEIAQVRIRAWLPDEPGLDLRSGLRPEGNGFTLQNVSRQPEQDRRMKDGKPWVVLTWHGSISATKAGNLPASIAVDTTMLVPDPDAPKRPRRQRGGPFDDPFFDRAFNRMDTRMIRKDVTLKSDDQEIEVRPLPREGRPEGFTGAIGDFQFGAVEFPDNWKTGEPQQIRATLSGAGNFSLMKAPTLSPAENWKTYPGQEQFNGGDETSFSGSKIFQFSAVPRKGGDQDVSLAFSFFNPDKGAYQTLSGGEKKILISGEDIPEEKEPAVEASTAPANKPDELIAQKESLSPAATLVPLASRLAFIEMCGSGCIMILVGWVLGILRRRRTDPARLSRAVLEKVTREALAEASAATDVPTFFSASRLAIQQRLGAKWNQSPQAITTAEVTARVPADSPVVRFFQEADRHEYNRHGSGNILPEWRILATDAMNSITPVTR